LKRLKIHIYLLGLNNNKIIIKERNKNGNKETRNKGNLILESRGHRVKSKKESTFKELLNFRNFILGK
jgi:hypothetical protein